MSATLINFLFQTVNFAVLAGILSWAFFHPVRNALESRRNAQKQLAEQAAGQLAAADQAHQSALAARAALDAEAENLRVEARATAAREAADLLRTAREQIQRERETAQQQLTAISRDQLLQLGQQIAATAGTVVDRLLRDLNSPDLESALVRRACERLHEAGGRPAGETIVESAQTLPDETRAAIVAALGPGTTAVKYHLVPDLGAGVRIQMDNGVIDATSTGLAAFAERALVERLSTAVQNAGEHAVHG